LLHPATSAQLSVSAYRPLSYVHLPQQSRKTLLYAHLDYLSQLLFLLPIQSLSFPHLPHFFAHSLLLAQVALWFEDLMKLEALEMEVDCFDCLEMDL
jgi:hypothetical protein